MIAPKLRYVKSIASVRGLVYASDGLPVEVKGLSREEAEDLAAWATQLVRSAREKLGLGDRAVAVFHGARGGDVVVYEEGGESIVAVVAPGHGGPVARALSRGGPRCSVCGADLSEAVVVCQRCGARNPFTAAYCASCGAPLRYRRCPSCGATIDSEGFRVGLRDRVLARPAETITQ